MCVSFAIDLSAQIFTMCKYEHVTPRRVWLVRDAVTFQSWGFAFVEYANVHV
jgi:uncharacterized protein (DUF486 family)